MGYTLVQTPQASAPAQKRYRLIAPPPGGGAGHDPSSFDDNPMLPKQFSSVNVEGKEDRTLTPKEQFDDWIKSAGLGVANFAVNTMGLPADLFNMGQYAASKAMGETDETRAQRGSGAFDVGPTSSKIRSFINEKTRPAPTEEQLAGGPQPAAPLEYVPRTTGGEVTERMGEYGPAVAMGPGGIVRKTAMTTAPAVAGVAARNAAEGTPFEPYAEPIAAIAAGGLAAGTKSNLTKQIAKGAPTEAAINTAKNQLYDKLRKAGIVYDQPSYEKFALDLKRRLESEGLDDMIHPSASRALERVLKEAKQSPDFNKMETLRKIAGDASRGFDPKLEADRRFASEIIRELDDFSEQGKLAHQAGIPSWQVKPLMDEARATAQRSIKARKINRMIEEAQGYSHGADAGIRAQFQKLERDIAKGKERGWTDTEKAAIRQAAHGTKTSNALNTVGRAGVDLGVKGNRALALPAALVALLADFTATGGVLTAAKVAGGLGATSAAKVAGRKMTENYADRARKVVLAGKEAQQAASKLSEKQIRELMIRRIIAGDIGFQASRPLLEPSMSSVLEQ